MQKYLILLFMPISFLLVGCANSLHYQQIKNPRPIPSVDCYSPSQQQIVKKKYREVGIASWYGRSFHRKRTSSGERYNMYQLTAAHKTLPIPSYVLVTNLNNGRSTRVRINDRGPFISNRIIDLSYAAAKKIGMVGSGLARVKVEAISSSKKKEIMVA